MSGLKTACLYGFKPLEFGFCIASRHKEIQSKMIAFIAGRYHNTAVIKKALKQYIAAYPKYQLIAGKNNIIDPFSEKVVRAYWIGNNLLTKAGGFKAHHNYHVYMVGTLSENVIFTDISKDLCRISAAQVTDIGKKITVQYRPILKNKSQYCFGKAIEKEIDWDKKILPMVNLGNMISMHWNQAIEVITQAEASVLEKYTFQALKNL